MMKRTVFAALSCVTALSMLAACSSGTTASSSSSGEASSEAPASSEHIHTASVWDRDVNKHWQLCECGETFNIGDHTLGEDLICTECGSEIWMSDSGADIYNYNENGDYTRYSTYGPDGELWDDLLWEYQIGAGGSYEKVTSYYNGALSEEVDYVLDADGTMLSFVSTTYYDDGTFAVGAFTPEYEPIISYEYAADGTELYRHEYEYAEAGGMRYLARSCDYTGDVLSLVQEFNEYGDNILFRSLDEEGNTVTEMVNEYTYTADGEKETMKFYVGGTLVQESFYTTADGETYEHMMHYYNEDGTKSVTEYNIHEDMEKDTVYDASGNILNEYTYENEYTEDGYLLAQRVYESGVLMSEYLYTIDADEDYFYHYLCSETIYNEDGTKNITEYNMDGEIVKETAYDANGVIVE